MSRLNKVQIEYNIAIQEFIRKLKDLGLFNKYRNSLRFFEKNDKTYLEISLDKELMDILDLIDLKQRKS